MKKIASIAVLMMTVLVAQAQKVTFYSPEFEDGVRYHLGLGESDDVQQTQMDTITVLNLSGLDITDIRDAVYLTAIKRLDLSYNEIEDVSPLLPLESLQVLNLSNNHLESIDLLAFMQSESLEVDVSNNYISDFSYFYSPTECEFTFIGMGMQLEKDAPYFDIYQLYANINDDDQPIVLYRGYTNMVAECSINYGSSDIPAQLDGETHTAQLPMTQSETAMVTLTNSERSETTYVVPPTEYSAKAGSTIILTTGLPEDYALYSAYASKGTVEIDGNTLKYTAPDKVIEDVVNFNYFQDSTLKGYSRFYVNRGASDVVKGDVNGDKEVDTKDIIAITDYIAGKTDEITPENTDMNDDNTINIADIIQIINIIFSLQ